MGVPSSSTRSTAVTGEGGSGCGSGQEVCLDTGGRGGLVDIIAAVGVADFG